LKSPWPWLLVGALVYGGVTGTLKGPGSFLLILAVAFIILSSDVKRRKAAEQDIQDDGDTTRTRSSLPPLRHSDHHGPNVKQMKTLGDLPAPASA